jgi:hypothetical protein
LTPNEFLKHLRGDDRRPARLPARGEGREGGRGPGCRVPAVTSRLDGSRLPVGAEGEEVRWLKSPHRFESNVRA